MKNLNVLITLIIVISAPLVVEAQWTTGTHITNTNTGDVVIGGSATPSTLKVYGRIENLFPKTNTSLQGEFLGTSGWWGFRTDTQNVFHFDTYNNNNPKSMLSINQEGQVFLNARKSNIPLAGEMLGSSGWWGFRTDTQAAFHIDIYNNNSPKSVLSINQNGNVGIGITAPDAPLTVKGTIHTNEVRVDMDAPIQGPDYVFEKDYDLLSLTELETYINQNKHLPEVPSAKEMETNGLNLKEMNLILLKKVEELTLHLIEMKKENAEQNKLIETLIKK